MKISMKNNLGVIREAKIGFSWTTLFFGAFTPLIRGDWKWFFIQAIIALMTYGLSHVVFSFIYNKIYITELLNQGYVPVTEEGKVLLQQKGILAK